jgi:hypothetical protein
MSSSQQCRPKAARPSDFPLGSPESRAAARMLLEHQRQSANTIYIDVPRPNRHPQGQDPAKPYLKWSSKAADGKIWRCVYLPPGMSHEGAERLLGK